MIDKLHTVTPPKDGVWRVGRKDNPVAFSKPESPSLGEEISPRNRFDDLLGNMPTSYYSSTAEGAIAETAVPLRTKPVRADLLPEDDTMGPSTVPAAYRKGRVLVQAQLAETQERPNLKFVDLQDAENLAQISLEFADLFAYFKLDQVTLAEIHGTDRRITSAIASAIMHATDSSGIPLYAGARYFSKFGQDYENWVIFDGVKTLLIEARPIELTDPALIAAAKRLKLRFH